MKSRIFGLQVAGTIFGLACFMQLFRLLTQMEIVVGGYPIPLWASGIAAVIAGGLSVWLWRLAKQA